MANTSRKGNVAELFVKKTLEEEGWVVGSLRKAKGGGDHLAVHPDGRIWLIETKGCKADQLWSNFRRDQRQEMRDVILPAGGERFCAHVCRRKIRWIPEADWPT